MATEERHLDLKVVHDRPTLIAFASLASWSWFVYGFGASLALMADEQQVAAWLTGLHAPALALGGVVGALATPYLNQRFGRGRMMRFSALAVSVCIVWYLIPGLPVGGTLSAIFAATFFGNIIVVCVNSFIAVHQGPASAPAFTENLALAALMGLLAPITIGLAAASVLGWRAGLALAVVAFLAIEVWRGRTTATFGGPGEVPSRHEAGRLPSITYWALMAGTLYVGAEFCISLWGVSFLREQTGMSPEAAAAGLGAYLGGLFVGRVFGSQLTRHLPSETLLRLSLAIGLVAFMVAWFLSNPVAVLAMFFITGVGLSLTWPLSLARILRSAPGNNDRAAAMTLAFTTAAIGLAPFALGAMVDSLTVRGAFLLVPVMLLGALFIVLYRRVPE